MTIPIENDNIKKDKIGFFSNLINHDVVFSTSPNQILEYEIKYEEAECLKKGEGHKHDKIHPIRLHQSRNLDHERHETYRTDPNAERG